MLNADGTVCDDTKMIFWWPEGEAACIYVDTIEWRKTFRGMA